jgi:hypothetical protein
MVLSTSDCGLQPFPGSLEPSGSARPTSIVKGQNTTHEPLSEAENRFSKVVGRIHVEENVVGAQEPIGRLVLIPLLRI